MSAKGVIGCSNIVKAVVLQGMLAEAGIYGRIERGHNGYAIRVTHEEPLGSTMTRPTLVWSNPNA
jgi:hypothetical protein